MNQQNYKNHRRYIIMYHGVTFLLIVLLLVSSIYYTIKAANEGSTLRPALFVFLISFVLLNLFFYTRLFAAKVQDRAIKAEENFRHFILTGKQLDKNLTMRQIVGLRFASDEEFPDLTKQAIENGMSEDEIKKSIKNWRADNHRI